MVAILIEIRRTNDAADWPQVVTSAVALALVVAAIFLRPRSWANVGFALGAYFSSALLRASLTADQPGHEWVEIAYLVYNPLLVLSALMAIVLVSVTERPAEADT